MKEHPLIFSTPMVQAILEGRKTMTGRIVKSKHESGMFAVATAKYEPNCMGYYHNRCIESLDWDEGTVDGGSVLCPYGEVGDTIWVRETAYFHKQEGRWIYRASEPLTDSIEYGYRWKPSIFMPKAAARIFLEITDIKVERLYDISEEDAIAEGIQGSIQNFGYKDYMNKQASHFYANDSFRSLWQSINGKESWNLNPWVWVISFQVLSTTGRPTHILSKNILQTI